MQNAEKGAGRGKSGTDSKFVGRLKAAIKEGGGNSAVSAKTGISVSTLGNWLAERSEPKARQTAVLAEACGVDIEWLITGRGAMARPVEVTFDDIFEKRDGQPQTDIPVIGLAECGLTGWFQEQPFAVTTHRLPDISTDAFAVIAIGESMAPAGIHPGFLCISDPTAARSSGDIVFVERRDKRATLKKLVKEDAEWLWLQGWLPPENEAAQEPYTEQLRRDQVARIATIIYIKRRL